MMTAVQNAKGVNVPLSSRTKQAIPTRKADKKPAIAIHVRDGRMIKSNFLPGRPNDTSSADGARARAGAGPL
jgi:hypothetical protein